MRTSHLAAQNGEGLSSQPISIAQLACIALVLLLAMLQILAGSNVHCSLTCSTHASDRCLTLEQAVLCCHCSGTAFSRVGPATRTMPAACPGWRGQRALAMSSALGSKQMLLAALLIHLWHAHARCTTGLACTEWGDWAWGCVATLSQCRPSAESAWSCHLPVGAVQIPIDAARCCTLP